MDRLLYDSLLLELGKEKQIQVFKVLPSSIHTTFAGTDKGMDWMVNSIFLCKGGRNPLLLIPGLLGLLVGRIRRGRVVNLSSLHFKRLYVLYISLILQLLVGKVNMGTWGPYVMVVSYLLLLVFLGGNLHLPGMCPTFVGIFLNTMVIAVNGGQMPVALEFLGLPLQPEMLSALRGKHILLTAATRLPLLADIIPLKIDFLSYYRLYSIGDVLQMVGVFYLLQGGMQGASTGGWARGTKNNNRNT